MSVEDYMKQNGIYQLYEEMKKVRTKENDKVKEEIESEYQGGSGSGSGTITPSEIVDNTDIDNLFKDE